MSSAYPPAFTAVNMNNVNSNAITNTDVWTWSHCGSQERLEVCEDRIHVMKAYPGGCCSRTVETGEAFITDVTTIEAVHEPNSNIALAYFLWVTGGLVGLHRLYCGKTHSALGMCVAFLLGIGLLISAEELISLYPQSKSAVDLGALPAGIILLVLDGIAWLRDGCYLDQMIGRKIAHIGVPGARKKMFDVRVTNRISLDQITGRLQSLGAALRARPSAVYHTVFPVTASPSAPVHLL